MNKLRKITFESVCYLMLLVVLIGGAIFGFDIFKSRHQTTAYLSNTDKTIGIITVASADLKVLQNVNMTGNKNDYADRTDSGIVLGTNVLATSKSYFYDVIIKNDELSSVTSNGYYLRWKFEATIGKNTYSLNQYVVTSDTNVVLKNDGYFYFTNGTDAQPFNAQQSAKILEELTFTPEYNSETGKMESVLDKEISGAEMDIKLIIEGQVESFT